MDDLRRAIRTAVSTMDQPDYDALLKTFRDELNQLRKQRKIALGPDQSLGGDGLAVRVAELLAELGFTVQPGREENLEDLIVRPPATFTPAVPLVLEIKSGKAVSPNRDGLRELDDWVFEVSGEEQVRKGQLSVSHIHGWLTFGLGATLISHPSPHKGMFVYNGQLGTPFADRAKNWLGANEQEFAAKRNFCVASLECLVAWHSWCSRDMSARASFWQTIHATAGVLASPVGS